jgi:hypothetical protein
VWPRKAEERRYLEELMHEYQAVPAAEVEESESPDFLIRIDGRIVGIEVTEYVRRGTGERQAPRGGSSLRKIEDDGKRFAERAKDHFEEWYRTRLYVTFPWVGVRLPKRSAEVASLAAELAELVRGYESQFGFENCQVPSSAIAGSALADYIGAPWIMRLNEGYSSWSTGMAGKTTLLREEVQAEINRKTPKMNAYLQQCDAVWLLIVASGHHPSSWATLSDDVTRHAYQFPFERVIFFDRANRQVATLLRKEPVTV